MSPFKDANTSVVHRVNTCPVESVYKDNGAVLRTWPLGEAHTICHDTKPFIIQVSVLIEHSSEVTKEQISAYHTKCLALCWPRPRRCSAGRVLSEKKSWQAAAVKTSEKKCTLVLTFDFIFRDLCWFLCPFPWVSQLMTNFVSVMSSRNQV